MAATRTKGNVRNKRSRAAMGAASEGTTGVGEEFPEGPTREDRDNQNVGATAAKGSRAADTKGSSAEAGGRTGGVG